VNSPNGISEKDLRGLLDVVTLDSTAEPGAALPEQVMKGLADLIPCASISFLEMDARRRETRAIREFVFADLPDDDDDSDALFFDAYWDCVACCYQEQSGDHDAVTMFTDFYTDREFAALLMGEYFRRVGVWHQLLVTLPPKGRFERRLILFREPGDLPFSERDRLLLTLLRPHLIGIRDQVEAQQTTIPVLTPRQLELMRRIAHGETNRQVARDLGLSEGTVRKHLENIYRRLDVNNRVEALARIPAAHISSDVPDSVPRSLLEVRK